MAESMFPLQEMMLICRGCGGERQIPEHELEKINSVPDLHAFLNGRVRQYACGCGAKTCDVRLLPKARAKTKETKEEN